MIYVDSLLSCIPQGQFRWKKSCHMFCEIEELESLHEFANNIGLKRDWFQNKPGKMPHYDLHESRRVKALKLGAIELNRKNTVFIIKKWKEYAKINN